MIASTSSTTQISTRRNIILFIVHLKRGFLARKVTLSFHVVRDLQFELEDCHDWHIKHTIVKH